MPHVLHLGCAGGWAGIDSRSLCRRGLGAVIVMGSHTFLIKVMPAPAAGTKSRGCRFCRFCRCAPQGVRSAAANRIRIRLPPVRDVENGVRITLLLRPRLRNPYHSPAQYEAFHVNSARVACRDLGRSRCRTASEPVMSASKASGLVMADADEAQRSFAPMRMVT